MGTSWVDRVHAHAFYGCHPAEGCTMNVNISHKKIRIRDVVAAEMIKIISHPMAIAAIALTIMINLVFAIIDAVGVSFYVSSNQPPATISSFGVVMFFPIYVFLVLPVIAASS